MHIRAIFIFIFSALIGLSGCVAIDSVVSEGGVIKEQVAPFENERVVSVSPALIQTGYMKPKLGLYWEKSYGEKVQLSVRMNGAINFNKQAPFLIKISNNINELPPVNKKDFGTVKQDSLGNVTEKSYWLSKSQLNSIIEGKASAYRLSMLKTRVEGNFTYEYLDYQSYIYKPFSEFYKLVWPNK